MPNAIFKVTVFLLVLMAIILFCVIFGGFTSLYRSQDRIESAKVILIDTCRERLELLPGLAALSETEPSRAGSTARTQDIETAKLLISKLLNQQEPLENAQTKIFESLQNDIGLAIKDRLLQLESIYGQKNNRKFELLKKDLSKVQDKLFKAKERYNYEVAYFNRRVKTFPLSLMSKLFNFDGIVYYPLSDYAFLPAHKIFES
jgi:LemA protein